MGHPRRIHLPTGAEGKAEASDWNDVVSWAAAESAAAGCGAGHGRMTRVLSRSSSISRWSAEGGLEQGLGQ
jgi:hypothetical protein